MTNPAIISQLLRFYADAEKLKTTLRHSYTSNPARQESTAEHSWMLALIALTVFSHIKVQIDHMKVLKMLIIHDIAESITGDIPAFEVSERQNRKRETERKALERLCKNLPSETKYELISLWEEFEERNTAEAKVSQAIDKLEASFQHNIADISTWDQGDYDSTYYKNDYFEFDVFMRDLKDQIDTEMMIKIENAKQMKRVRLEHVNEFKKYIRKNNKIKHIG